MYSSSSSFDRSTSIKWLIIAVVLLLLMLFVMVVVVVVVVMTDGTFARFNSP